MPSPGDLLHPGIEPASPVAPARQADSLQLNRQGSLTDKLGNADENFLKISGLCGVRTLCKLSLSLS